jgi:hypothetical protein
MNLKVFIFSLILFLIFSPFSQAQVALAVSKNDNGSSVKYSLQVGLTLEEAYAKAQKDLEEQELKNIVVLKSTEETGHELNSGHYVLIIASRKNGGRFFVSYGLGVSPTSKQEATQRAITHLKEHDWGYENSYGYHIEKEGKVEDLYPSEEEE